MAGVNGTRLLTVLIVDDDSRVRAALVRMLDEVGDVRPIAVDSVQALRLATLITLDADVAVVDVPAPGTPGEVLVGQLAPAVPVVAMSLNGSMRRRAARAGAALFVEKDGDAGALVDAIRTAATARSSHNVVHDLGHASRDREGGHRDD
ncbi:MAG: response regulator [Actinomycetes bacterium]